MSWIYYLLYLEHISLPGAASKRGPKSAPSSGRVPEPIFDDFGRILASVGEPVGSRFRHFGRHFGGSKKDTNKFVKMLDGGRFCGMRGAPGEDYGGVNNLAERCRAEGAEQTEEKISESG